VGSSPNSAILYEEGAVGTAQLEWMACCISLSSFLIISYIVSCFAPFLCKISSKVSSIVLMLRSISSTLSTLFDQGLLVQVFFLDEGFCRETFLFFDVSTSISGSFGGVTLPFPCSSPSSPLYSWFTSSSPPPAGDSGLLSSKALPSSSISMFCTSNFFFFFFVLAYPSCLTWVTKGILMMSGSKISTSSTGTRNFVGHSLVISSIYLSMGGRLCATSS
jgi:hypothetical protein